ncbi:MAG: glycerophosphodiester phosphodiesterase family protein [Coriobacteriales bacterium]|nr:glycerophosphodiester phosphodiesterase family protein [Coriobacteriales bacterium]
MTREATTSGRHLKQESVRQVGFGRLLFDAIPEIWTYQAVAAILLGILLQLTSMGINLTVGSAGTSLTSANFKEVLLSWRGLVLLILLAVVILGTVALEIFAKIILCNSLLCGVCLRTRDVIKEGLASIKRFLTPTGIFSILYLLIAVPLDGIGFSVSLTNKLYVPHFVSEVINSTPLYLVAYWAVLAILTVIGALHAFVFHGVLIDDLTPSEARRQSTDIVRHHFWALVRCIVGVLFISFLVTSLSYFLLMYLPTFLSTMLFQEWGQIFMGMRFSMEEFFTGQFTDAQIELLLYRFCLCAVFYLGRSLFSLVVVIMDTYKMLRITRFYRDYAHEPAASWPELPKRHRYLGKVALMAVMGVLLLAGAFGGAVVFEELYYPDPVPIVAHRAGGTLAPENSLQGLEVAIEHGCFGSEIDIQRTSDGRYVVNHDDTLARLTGDRRAVQEMTFDEVRALPIRDTTGGDKPLQIATLEEMLDIIKGHEKLFIELKGVTADRQMVDDVVALVREKDCLEDVVLISLNYDVISYAETTYPEFDTGVLFFAALGDSSRLNADYLLMEEELTTDTRVSAIHFAKRKVGVWTVNTDEGIRKFLQSRVDLIITDRIDLAEEIQVELDGRSDLQRILDAFDS